MKKITIEIDPNGNSKVTTTGYAGVECKEATRKLQERLGHTQSDLDTPEMYETNEDHIELGGEGG